MKANPLACVLLMLLAVVVQLPAQQPISPSGTNATRSQAIAAWLSKVTITTTTKTNDGIETVTASRTNAVSGAEFAAIKAKAESGDPVAQYQLGSLAAWSVAGQTNTGDGRHWIRKAAENGLPEAQLDVGWWSYGDDPAEAFKWFRKAADQGYLKAQSTLAECYRDGTGTATDKHEAFIWFCKAAEGGDESAQFNLAGIYSNGIGVTNDAVKATFWYRKAAEQGDADAKYLLGRAYETGNGIETNIVEAVKWYRKAAEQDQLNAQNRLATMFTWERKSGLNSVEGSYEEGVKWTRKFAEEGNSQAQYMMGEIYSDGLFGVTKDYATALQWYRKSAEQGNEDAQHGIGLMYYNGKGVPKNGKEAEKWFRKAAEQGDDFAQKDLAYLYQDGDGVPQNFVEAYKWFNIAATSDLSFLGLDAAKRRDQLAANMSPEQIAEGQRRSAAFVPHKESASSFTSPRPDEIIATSPDNPTASGTGFFITDDGYLISNYHVVKDAAKVRLLTGAGLIDAKVVQVDAANDLALLKANAEGGMKNAETFKPLPIAASRTVVLGGTVATVGFPDIGLQGFAPKLAKGEIASLSGAGDDPRYFQISVPVQPGNSGGALVDERGNVIGIVSAKLDAAAALAASGALPENVNYAVKSSLLLSFLESVPAVSAKLKAPVTADRKFEDVVKSAQAAAVLVLVY